MIDLFPWQKDLVDRVREALRRAPRKRVVMQSPTGSGKTVMFGWYGRRAHLDNGVGVLYLTHRGEILGQVSNTLTRFELPHGIVAAGYPTTPHPVQVAMAQTFVHRLVDHRGRYGLIIIDECQHSPAPTWRKILDFFPGVPSIGASATPERLDGDPLKDLYDELVLGPTINWLIEHHFLAPAITYAPPLAPDLSGIRTVMGDWDVDELAARMTQAKLIGDLVEHYRQLMPQLPGLVFCCDLEHSRRTQEAFNNAGFETRHIDGHTPKAEREAAIADLGAGRLDLLTNVGLFSEGVDCPLLGLVIMARPTLSLALYLQMVGRGLRLGGGKRRALILDHAGNTWRHGLYNFEHQWSLKGREKNTAGGLVRRCPWCGAMIPINATECPECGHVFPPPDKESPPGTPQPEWAPGQLERVDEGKPPSDAELKCNTKGGPRSHASLKLWILAGKSYEERYLRALRVAQINGYQRGWIQYVLRNAPPIEC